MKKTMRKLLCLLMVIVVAANFAAPAMALSSNTTTKSSSDYFTDKDGNAYRYTCNLSASTSKATASISFNGISVVSCTVSVIRRDVAGTPYYVDAYDSDNYYASASVDSSVYTITEAHGNYTIISAALSELVIK